MMQRSRVILPVIERELRGLARQRFSYALRLIGPGVLMAFVAYWIFTPSPLSIRGGLVASAGAELFSKFQELLFWAIWLLVPVSCADAFSRERREGTLGLLFLTPLTPRAIVYAKGVTQGLRALTLWLAVLPLLTICLLAGGVSWTDVLISAMINLDCICLAMGAGLVASSLCRVWARALGLAAVLSAVFVGAFLLYAPSLVWSYTGTFRRWPMNLDLMERLYYGWQVVVDREGLWQKWPSMVGITNGSFIMAFVLLTLISVLLFLFLILFCAWRLRRDREQRPPSPAAARLKERLFTPVVARDLLRTWLGWELQHNPIGWLERRSWSGRLVMWSWFAIVACVYSSLFSNLPLYQNGFHAIQTLLATLLAGSIAFSAAGSFRRERETGVLELLLVAPMREGEIIFGRVRGLWTQFLPAIVLLCAVWLWGAGFLSHNSELGSVFIQLITFATIPVVGLYFSLARTNFIAALLWTMVVQLIAPLVMLAALAFLFPYTESPEDQYFIIPALQLMIAAVLGWRMYENLRTRAFAMT